MRAIEGITICTTVSDAHYGGEEVPDVVLHPETEEEMAKTVYKRTDAWRGYWEVEPLAGWKKVGEGTACGGWNDAPSGTSNREVEAKLKELVKEHREIVMVTCGGSNVFAMQYDVLARA
jgi:predicted SpoU family rRNA methylase